VQGWLYYVILPMAFMLLAAWHFQRQARRGQSGRTFTRQALLITTWFYFAINFAFFEFPWPWVAPTGRTPSGLIFFVCSVVLTLGARTRSRAAPRARGRQLPCAL